MPRGFGGGPHWWHNHFQDAGFRITFPRQVIFDLLNKTDKHLSAEDIYLEVHKKYPAIGLTTIYRTLELLVNMGLVFKFDFGDGRARYELSQGPGAVKHHHHLVCTNCGRVIDYTDYIEQEKELVNKTEEELSRKYNFEINNHQIQFLGLCEKCQENNK
jgi:Fur family ferric uptake transcriptional regulator